MIRVCHVVLLVTMPGCARSDDTDEAVDVGIEHLFAMGSCALEDDDLCPGGDPQSFDRATYQDLFVDPFGAGPSVGMYPTGNEGALYEGGPVPLCEDSTDAPSLSRDPATWICGDGLPVVRCTDGTRPIVHYFPPAAPSMRWIVEVSNGSNDCHGDECIGDYVRSSHRFSSAWGGSDEPGSPGSPLTKHKGNAGVLARPRFNDFHRLTIDQCGGGRGLGRAEGVAHLDDETLGTHDIPVYYHGSRIIRATLDRVLREAADPPTQVVFISNSNGSNGAYMEIDGWRDWLREHPRGGADLDVRLYANSFVRNSVDLEVCARAGCTDLLDSFDHGTDRWSELEGKVLAPRSTAMEEICGSLGADACVQHEGEVAADMPANGQNWNTSSYQSGGRAHEALEAWSVDRDASCLAAHKQDPSACEDSQHVLVYHLETPTYLALSGYDRTLRSSDITDFVEGYEAYSLADYMGRVVAVARGVVHDKPGQKDAVDQPGHGVWVSNSTEHKGATHGAKLDRELQRNDGSDVSLQDSFRYWLDAERDAGPLCISDGKAMNDPNNPMNTAHGGTAVSTVVCF